jgi:hypothetical protein
VSLGYQCLEKYYIQKRVNVIGKMIHHIGLYLKSRVNKSIIRLVLQQTKCFCTVEESIDRVKGTTHGAGENYTSNEEYASKEYKKQNSIFRRQRIQLNNGQRI